MLFKSYVVLIFLLLLTGCVSVPELQQQLANSSKVTHSYQEMNYAPLESAKSRAIKLDSESPTFMFEDGKSYYSALIIPDLGSPHKLNVKTYLTSDYLPSTSVVAPNFLFLDSNKQPLKTTKSFRLDPGVDFWLGGYFEGNVIVPAETAYLVLYTNNNSDSNLTTYSENGHEWPVPYAPAGKLALELSKPFPADYDFSTITIKDSIKVYSDSKADFFIVSEIDGKKVENSLSTTRRRNVGRGLSMTTSTIDRDVEIKPMTLTIMGRTDYAAPIQALTNPVYEVKGQIKFNPEKNKTYVVVGELSEANSKVWLEDAETHQVIGNKIETHDAKLGIMQK